MTLQEQNKETVKRYNEIVLTNGNLDALPEFIAPDFVNYSAPPDLPKGPENIRLQIVNFFRPAISELAVEIYEQVAEGDKVVTRKRYTGKHIGTFMGIPATNKTISLDVIEIVTLRDGKYADHRNLTDLFGLIQQLKS